MSVLSYYFAMSIDGYIAAANGELDWLDTYASEESFKDSPYAYHTYYKTVNSLIMGRKTYEAIKSMGSYPYPEKHGYVVSSDIHLKLEEPQLSVLHPNDLLMLNSEKEHFTGRMWLVGGGILASTLMELNLIDELIITVLPCTLGSGIRWIGPNSNNTEWLLHDNVDLGDIMQSQYIKLYK